MIPYCKDTGVGIIPWSPLARGALTRSFSSRETHREKTDRFLNTLIRSRESEADKMIIDRVEEIAEKKGVSMAGVATAWSIAKGDIPIIGIGSIERVDQAVENSKVELTDDDLAYLEEPYIPKPIQGY